MQSLCNIGDWILKFKNQSSKIYQRKMDGIDGKSHKGITGNRKINGDGLVVEYKKNP